MVCCWTADSGDEVSAIGPIPGGSLRYLPDNDYIGDDGFTYRASDATTSSAASTVTISVFSGYRANPRQIGQELSGGVERERFGGAVALSGDGRVLAIGAPGDEVSSTATAQLRMFRDVGGQWLPMGLPITGTMDDQLGSSIALSSDGFTVAVG